MMIYEYNFYVNNLLGKWGRYTGFVSIFFFIRKEVVFLEDWLSIIE